MSIRGTNTFSRRAPAQCHLFSHFFSPGPPRPPVWHNFCAFIDFFFKTAKLRERMDASKKNDNTNSTGTDEEFSKSRQLLADLIGLPDLQKTFENEGCSRPQQVYTQAPTLFLLVLQRLGGGLSLSAAVKELIEHHQDLLPKNRRVQNQTLSENSSAYNKARQQLPLEKVQAFSTAICDYLSKQSKPVWQGRRVMILDGTTITLPPTSELKKAFPPATNQHGESVWPVAMLMVASEMATGCVLVPEVDPMYGPNNVSEADQAERIIDRLPIDSLVMADSGFGIFRTAHHCDQQKKEFVFRLTASRFKALRRKAQLVQEEKGTRTWHLLWQPSTKDLTNNPDLSPEAEIEVFVHEVELKDQKNLYLVTNVEADAQSLADLYLGRYKIEFDIRDLKVTMDTENILAKKLDTAQKELLGSVIAYNLVAQFRRQAAELVNVEPRRLSFSGVWLNFRYDLLYKPPQSFEEWQQTYANALANAAKKMLPNRSRPRSYPRIAHPRRPKTTKFKKSLKNKTQQDPPDQ